MPPQLPTRDFHFLPIPNAPTNPTLLALSNSSTWTYCGPLLTLTNPQAATTTITTTNTTAINLPATFHTWSSQTLNRSLLPQLTPFLHAAHAFLAQHGVRHYWLTVRASQPPPPRLPPPPPTASTSSNIAGSDAAGSDAAGSDAAGAPPPQPQPRWHTAGDFFANPDLDLDDVDVDSGGAGVHRWKLGATLQGPGTLFAGDGVRAREVLRGVERGAEGSAESSAGGLEGVKVMQPAAGEMVFMRVGEEEGAVVSEPRVVGDSVVVSVVPGTEAGFRAVLERYGMEEFPRSWSVGLPGWLDTADEDEAEGAEDEGVSMERYEGST